jgi:phosphate starvation-inducible PhoH-like protein
MIVSGDITQVGLPRGVRSGLHDVERLFNAIPDVGIVRLTEADVVRHPLVAQIVAAYDRAEDP